MCEKIILHSNKCPKCKILETKMKQKGIKYEENNDVQIMLDLGLKTAPALQIGERVLEFKEAVDWVNNYEEII